MTDRSFTLLADGSFDEALCEIIQWTIRQHSSDGWRRQMAKGPAMPKIADGLEVRIVAANNYFPCDLLFVHRDAEGDSLEARRDEIAAAAADKPHVALVPVRATEAWLLFDSHAIRAAADNPNGTVALALPPLNQCESLVDPKQTLRQAVLRATELSTQRRRKFERDRLGRACRLLSERVDDFAPLRALPSFTRFEANLVAAIAALAA